MLESRFFINLTGKGLGENRTIFFPNWTLFWMGRRTPTHNLAAGTMSTFQICYGLFSQEVTIVLRPMQEKSQSWCKMPGKSQHYQTSEWISHKLMKSVLVFKSYL